MFGHTRGGGQNLADIDSALLVWWWSDRAWFWSGGDGGEDGATKTENYERGVSRLQRLAAVLGFFAKPKQNF